MERSQDKRTSAKARNRDIIGPDGVPAATLCDKSRTITFAGRFTVSVRDITGMARNGDTLCLDTRDHIILVKTASPDEMSKMESFIENQM